MVDEKNNCIMVDEKNSCIMVDEKNNCLIYILFNAWTLNDRF